MASCVLPLTSYWVAFTIKQIISYYKYDNYTIKGLFDLQKYKNIFLSGRHDICYCSLWFFFQHTNGYVRSVYCNTWCQRRSLPSILPPCFLKYEKAKHRRRWPIRIKLRAVRPRPLITRPFLLTKVLSTDLF